MGTFRHSGNLKYDDEQLFLSNSYNPFSWQSSLPTTVYPQKTVAKQSELYRLLFHARFFRYEVSGIYLMVDLVGFEPTTSWMQARRSPARATSPKNF